MLRVEAWLAVAVAALMAMMAVATIVWWVSLTNSAPWFFAGQPVGSSGSPLPPQLLLAAALMVLATAVAGLESWRAGRAALGSDDLTPS